jgi:hypothetical protein
MALLFSEASAQSTNCTTTYFGNMANTSCYTPEPVYNGGIMQGYLDAQEQQARIDLLNEQRQQLQGFRDPPPRCLLCEGVRSLFHRNEPPVDETAHMRCLRETRGNYQACASTLPSPPAKSEARAGETYSRCLKRTRNNYQGCAGAALDVVGGGK